MSDGLLRRLVIEGGVAVFLWVGLLTNHKREGNLVFDVAVVALIVGITILLELRRSRRAVIPEHVVTAAFAVDLLLFLYSGMYWGIGGANNFNHHLTHLDGLYFAIGTLTTVGTGSLYATTDLARGIQLSQEVVDFLVIFVFLALLFGRYQRNISHQSPKVSDSPTAVLDPEKD